MVKRRRSLGRRAAAAVKAVAEAAPAGGGSRYLTRRPLSGASAVEIRP